ncbi:MAG: RNA methyltransferase [Eubacterium sp.]|nr:RNA methyltransferase [Eubacterium sp.]
MEKITSPNNERIKQIAKIISTAKERKYSSRYMVEGLRMVREIPEENLDHLFMTQFFFEKYSSEDERLLNLIEDSDRRGRFFIVSDSVIKKLADTENPQGVVAIVKMETYGLEDLLGDASEVPLILVIEKMQDPGNMGTIIRTAEGAGATGLLVSYDSVDVYSPKVVRSTMGSIFRKNIVITYDLLGDIRRLKKKGVKVYGMHLNGSSIYETALTGPSAFLIGNEGAGLTEEISGEADKLLRIPMMGEVESLNAGTSAAIISYEALRQRIEESERLLFGDDFL